MRQARVQSRHDPSEIGEVAIVEHVAEDMLQEGVVALTGFLDIRAAVPSDSRVGRPRIVGIGLPFDESSLLHAVEKLRQAGRRQDHGLSEVTESEPAACHVQMREHVVTRHAEPADTADIELKLISEPGIGSQQGEESRHPPRRFVLDHVIQPKRIT